VRECSHWGLEEKHAEQPRLHRLDLVRRDHRDEEELLSESVSTMKKRQFRVWLAYQEKEKRQARPKGGLVEAWLAWLGFCCGIAMKWIIIWETMGKEVILYYDDQLICRCTGHTSKNNTD